jgi:hypothetical protein
MDLASILDALQFFNCLLKSFVVHVGQVKMITCFVTRSTGGYDGIDSKDEIPLVLYGERLVAGLI